MRRPCFCGLTAGGKHTARFLWHCKTEPPLPVLKEKLEYSVPVTASILPGKTYCLTPSIRKELETFFGADLSAVRFAVCERLSRTPFAALTGGSNLYFAPEFFEPDRDAGRFLLVHEMAHILQQRGSPLVDPGRGWAALLVAPRWNDRRMN